MNLINSLRSLWMYMSKSDYSKLHQSTGILKYSDPYRLVVEVDRGISQLAYALIPKWLPKQRPRWVPHITVVRTEKETPVNLEHWGKYQNQPVLFYYTSYIHEGKIYYWLNCFCNQLEDIRAELGLPVVSQYTLPPEGFKKCFHMTVANKK